MRLAQLVLLVFLLAAPWCRGLFATPLGRTFLLFGGVLYLAVSIRLIVASARSRPSADPVERWRRVAASSRRIGVLSLLGCAVALYFALRPSWGPKTRLIHCLGLVLVPMSMISGLSGFGMAFRASRAYKRLRARAAEPKPPANGPPTLQ